MTPPVGGYSGWQGEAEGHLQYLLGMSSLWHGGVTPAEDMACGWEQWLGATLASHGGCVFCLNHFFVFNLRQVVTSLLASSMESANISLTYLWCNKQQHLEIAKGNIGDPYQC